jgi:hypothetical protein
MQWYFCEGTRQSAIPVVLSQKDASQNSVLEPSFPGMDIPNTSPSPTEFLVTMHSGTYSLQKNSTGNTEVILYITEPLTR